MNTKSLVLLIVLCLLLLPSIGVAQQPVRKKLIGWSNEPDTRFMREHIAEMEATPFDGCVFHISAREANGTNVDFAFNCWGKRAFTDAEVQHAIDDLKATPFKRLTHNFLRINVIPGDFDWFDDFSPVLNNARLAARVAREGKAAGIVLDTEQYDGNHFLFAYNQQRDRNTKSFEQYAAQARVRGRELMEALQAGYPDVHLLLTFGYGLSLEEARYLKKHPGEPRYGLLAPMLDGMFDAATGSTKIVDGYEHSYGYKTAAEFAGTRERMHGPTLFNVAKTDPAKIDKHFSLAFGLWLDYGWRSNGWNADDAEKNYFTPQGIEQSAGLALENADEYVWIYSEQPRWWSVEGKPQNLPPTYEQAFRKAVRRDGPTASAGQ